MACRWEANSNTSTAARSRTPSVAARRLNERGRAAAGLCGTRAGGVLRAAVCGRPQCDGRGGCNGRTAGQLVRRQPARRRRAGPHVGDGASLLQVVDIAVRPDWQRRGLGRPIVAALMDDARHRAP
ncbi:GNAT family N-acetyltransferase [Frateuria terrea]|uniref:GNAT family N-acetyltransferase n=1 Tax=Frateuria terrea TaxID=529704 RepID=UPI00318406F6